MAGLSETSPSETKNQEQVDEEIACSNSQSGINTLSDFVVSRVLSNNPQRKTVFVEGLFNNKAGKAVLVLEKPAFNDNLLNSLSTYSQLQSQFVNDVYGNYELIADPKINCIKTTLIYPATEKHIQKYEPQPIHIINETKEFYETITLPHLSKDQFQLQWVYNILEHKSEVERILLEDEDQNIGFVLLPDLKWDGKQTDNLYVLAIVRPRGLRSLRDLTDAHLNLLLNVRSKGLKVIEEKFGVPESQLRVYLHYRPTFYHLHIHFTYLMYEAPGIYAEKAHLLDSVISNIQLKPDYYQEAALPFVIGERDTLFTCYESRGIVKKVPPKEEKNEIPKDGN